MPTFSTLLAFGAASLALLVVPGPAVLFIVNRSVADGRAVGLASVAGVELGTYVHAVAAALGLSAALAASAVAFNVIKWAGAAYLVVLGVRTLLHPPDPSRAEDTGTTPQRAFVQGIVVNVLNPKVALFFLSFLPQFIDPARGGAGTQALILGLEFVVIGCLTDGSYALAASHVREVLVRGRGLAFVQRYVAGAVYIGLGIVAAGTGHRRTAP